MIFVLTYVQTCCGGGCEKYVAISIEMFTVGKYEDIRGICGICLLVLQYIKPVIINIYFSFELLRLIKPAFES